MVLNLREIRGDETIDDYYFNHVMVNLRSEIDA